MQKLVSIIMNCYNGENFLKSSLDSIQKQKYRNFELIFYDNCSTDNSKKIYKSYKDKRFKYFSTKKKIPLGRARYNSLKKVSGEYFLFCDSDDYLMPEKIFYQMKLFKDKNIAAVFSNSLFISKLNTRKLYNNKIKDGKIFYDLIKNYYISFDTIIFKKNLVLKLDETLDKKFDLIHDLDLIIRLSKIYKIKYCNKVLSKWRAHFNSTSNNAYIKIANEKEQFIKKILSMHPKDKKLKKEIYTFNQKKIIEVCIGHVLSGQKNKMKFLMREIDDNIYKTIFTVLYCLPFSSFIMKKIIYFNKMYLLK
tara:strand:- start:4241 stop:5161 length:921 start_codon:yes stop_codon:yes gene_type:complete